MSDKEKKMDVQKEIGQLEELRQDVKVTGGIWIVCLIILPIIFAFTLNHDIKKVRSDCKANETRLIDNEVQHEAKLIEHQVRIERLQDRLLKSELAHDMLAITVKSMLSKSEREELNEFEQAGPMFLELEDNIRKMIKKEYKHVTEMKNMLEKIMITEVIED